MSASRIALLVLTGIFIAQIGFYYPQLPERMASHFDAAGNPDSWMSKKAFVIFELIILSFVVGQFLLVPLLVKKLPVSLVNLPNKDYWMAEERREQTLQIIRNYFEWFAAALLLMFIGVNQLVILANLRQGNLAGGYAWLAVAAFIMFSVVWTIGLMRRFRKPAGKL